MKGIVDNKIFRILFGIIKGFFITIIVIYLLFILFQRLSGNRSLFGYRMFTVASGSMAGVYEINDVIAVRDYDIKKLKIGDDIAYRGVRGGLEGMLVTHRIIRIENGTNGERIFVTRGVNAPAEDPSVLENQIMGKVVGVVPIISPLNHAVKSQLGFFLLIFCPLVIVIVLEVLQTITDIQLEKNEIQEIHKESTKSKKKFKQDNNHVEENKQEEDSSEKFTFTEEESSKEKQNESRDEIQVSEHEKRESETYIEVPEVVEMKEEREKIEII